MLVLADLRLTLATMMGMALHDALANGVAPSVAIEKCARCRCRAPLNSAELAQASSRDGCVVSATGQKTRRKASATSSLARCCSSTACCATRWASSHASCLTHRRYRATPKLRTPTAHAGNEAKRSARRGGRSEGTRVAVLASARPTTRGHGVVHRWHHPNARLRQATPRVGLRSCSPHSRCFAVTVAEVTELHAAAWRRRRASPHPVRRRVRRRST